MNEYKMGGQQSSQANRRESSGDNFENHSKINFVSPEERRAAQKMTPHERKVLESMCVGTKLIGDNVLRTRGPRASIQDPRVLSRDTAHVFSIKRKLFGSLDLDIDNVSSVGEDDGFPIPPPSPFRRGGVSSGSVKDRKKSVSIPKDQRSKESLTRVFNTNLFFNHLDANERNEISDAMFKETHEAGDVVIRQGDEGEHFYIIDMVGSDFKFFLNQSVFILQGEVEVLIDDKVVTTITAGGSFGELALIYGTPRAASIVAKTNLILWGIDRSAF